MWIYFYFSMLRGNCNLHIKKKKKKTFLDGSLLYSVIHEDDTHCLHVMNWVGSPPWRSSCHFSPPLGTSRSLASSIIVMPKLSGQQCPNISIQQCPNCLNNNAHSQPYCPKCHHGYVQSFNTIMPELSTQWCQNYQRHESHFYTCPSQQSCLTLFNIYGMRKASTP